MSDLVKEFCKIFWDVSYVVFMRLHLPTAGVVVNEIESTSAVCLECFIFSQHAVQRCGILFYQT